MRSLRLVALGVLGATGCGARQEQARREMQDFSCRDREVSYVARQHIAGSELGVQMDCAPAGPRVLRWRVDRQGQRVDDARSMTPGEFDRVWREVDATGWQYLKDCTTGTLGKDDPVYAFVVKDDQNQSSFKCQTTTVPFPYNGIVDPLDVTAQRGGHQLGDDEPADLKALDQKPAR
ncbi:MAG: hypothetical protein ACTHU0_29155 [Kofleriaceae bacterium]